MRFLAVALAALILAAGSAIATRYSITPDAAEAGKHLAWGVDHWTGAVDLCYWETDRSAVFCDRYNAGGR